MAPTSGEVLALIAAATPWFPAAYAQTQGVPRDSLDAAIQPLWTHQLIEARDWVKGLNQGYGLTPDGEKAANDPALLARILAGKGVESEVKPRGGPTTYDRGERARGSFYGGAEPSRPIVTQLLIAANIAVFVVGLSMAWRSGAGRSAYLDGTDIGTLLRLGSVSGDALLRGEWWRLGTANFVHNGMLHLMLNVYCLFSVGALAEDLWGRWRFAGIAAGSALAGTTAATMMQPAAAVSGASGLICGVMASLAVWLLLYRQHLDPQAVRDFARSLLFAVVLIGAVSFMPRVSWEGHLGGALGGIVLTFALDLIRPGSRRRSIAGVVLAVAFPFAVLGLLAAMMLHSERWRPLMAREAAQQQAAYFQGLEPELAEIAPPGVSNLVAAYNRTKGNPLRFAKVKAEAKQLQAKAEALLAKLPDVAPPGRFVSDAPVKVHAYATSVADYARELVEYLQADRANLDGLDEFRRQIEDRWMSLRRTVWSR